MRILWNRDSSAFAGEHLELSGGLELSVRNSLEGHIVPTLPPRSRLVWSEWLFHYVYLRSLNYASIDLNNGHEDQVFRLLFMVSPAILLFMALAHLCVDWLGLIYFILGNKCS